MKMVPEFEFRRHQKAGNGPTYRDPLLLAMLAAGLRYCSTTTINEQYVLPVGESIFAQRSKALLESELRQADITTVQALLILGELETSAGNELTACLYAGMASKLIFDLRLDFGVSQDTSFSETEIEVRHWSLWCASVQDKCCYPSSMLLFSC
jgi:hypothetical protein